jgi:NADH:ubiquinone oxidoreductase subunit 6 (subunit J)
VIKTLNIILALNCGFATLVIFCKNSLYSLLNFILLILGLCIILFYFRIEFLALIILLIYVGAITILFLFIIIMLQLNEKSVVIKHQFYTALNDYLIYTVLLIKLSVILFYFNKKLALSINQFSFEFLKYNSDMNFFYNPKDTNFFLSLFINKYFFVILVGFILLFSMIGAISLCLKPQK